MPRLEVFDPAMCCSTGLCGTEIDPALVSFAALLTQLSQKGVKVERYNLGQQPMAFVQNPVVKALLDKEGVAALPLILLNGKVATTGRYPERGELAAWFKLKATAAAVPAKSDCCCDGGTC